jgi:hypothetical protein
MPAMRNTLRLQNRLATFFDDQRTERCRNLAGSIYAGSYLERLRFFVNTTDARKATDLDLFPCLLFDDAE